jgi:hypothetical protein
MTMTFLHTKKRGGKEKQPGVRKTAVGCLQEVTEAVEHLNRKLAAMYPITHADIDELSFRVSMAEAAIEKHAEYWYEKGKAERGLFDG